jgi:hypothetical protein
MFRSRGFFRFLLMGLLVMSLFGIMRNSAFQSGWTQGYYAGQSQTAPQAAAQTASESPADNAAPAPQAPYRGYHGWGGGFFSPVFWIVGGVFKFFLFLFLFGCLVRLFRYGRFRRWHHHKGHHHHSKEWKHWHNAPWFDDDGEEPIMKA